MSGCIGKTNGLSGCHFTYVSQMDPKGGWQILNIENFQDIKTMCTRGCF